MNRNTMIAIGAVLAVLVVGAAVALNYDTDTPPATPTQTTTTTQTETTTEPEATVPATDNDVKLTIVYTDAGFDKPSYTVARGANILVKNTSNSTLEFSSDEHPTHQENPELNMRELNPGEEATFSVSEAGTWDFHDHLDSSKTGTLVVT